MPSERIYKEKKIVRSDTIALRFGHTWFKKQRDKRWQPPSPSGHQFHPADRRFIWYDAAPIIRLKTHIHQRMPKSLTYTLLRRVCRPLDDGSDIPCDLNPTHSLLHDQPQCHSQP